MNQQNHYISTYQKDYIWPHMLDVYPIQQSIKPIIAVKDCTCIDSRQVLKEFLTVGLGKYYDWSRMGPIGRLLEPKIYSKIKTFPETNTTRVDQASNILVKKLDEKCSSLSDSLLDKIFKDETIARVEADRMKTIYQMDYSDPAARITQRETALMIVDMNDQHVQYHGPIKITIDDNCLSHCHLFSSRCKANTSVRKLSYKQKNRSKCGKKDEDIEKRQMLLSSWRSEYQDSISKIGHTIIRTKLHHTKKKNIPLQYQHCTTSN